MAEPVSRLARAMRLLRIGDDATAESLADALWLANVLPRMYAPGGKTAKPEDGGSSPDGDETGTGLPPGNGETPPPTPPAEPSGGPTDRAAAVYAKQTPKDDEPFIPATLINVPASDALPNRLLVERALKPFLRRFPSRRVKQLDPEATAMMSAERKAVTPVFTPLPERWFDVLLLMEVSDSMEVWADTVRELEALLARHGAFRNVRVVRYRVRGESVVLTTTGGQQLSQKVAADPDGRRLCLFLTDGVSPEWRRAPLIDYVETLGARTVVAIVQMLPDRAWGHTQLGDAMDRLHSLAAAAPNGALQREDPFTGKVRRVNDASRVPVLTLEPNRVETWARFVMSPRRIVSAAVRLEVPVGEGSSDGAPASDERLEDRLAAFRSIASGQAFQLMRVLAAAPLTLPVMRLIQQSMTGPREQVHLAEVLMSGLIERVTPSDSSAAPSEVFYEFVPGLREMLHGTLSSREVDVTDAAMTPARQRLREFVERETGRKVKDFRALLADPDGLEKLPANARAFVEVSRRIYEMRGLVPERKAAGDGPVVLRVEVDLNAVVMARDVLSAAMNANGAQVYALVFPGLIRPFALKSGGLVPGKPWVPPWQPQLLLQASANPSRALVVASGRLYGLDSPYLPVFGVLAAGIQNCSLSPDGRFCLMSRYGEIEVWEIERQKTVLVPPRRDVDVTALAISNDPESFVAAFADGTLMRYTRGVPELIRRLSASCHLLAISENGRRAISISRGDGLLVWNFGGENPNAFARALASAPRSVSPVDATSVAMTPDGGIGVVGGTSDSVRVYDLNGPSLIAEFRHGDKPVVSVSITANGRKVLSAAGDIRIWDVPLPLTPQLKRARVSRRVSFAVTPKYAALGEQVRRELAAAGHSVVDATAGTSFEFHVEVGDRPPFASDALFVSRAEEIPGLHQELDRDPMGPLVGVPYLIVKDVARPKVEAALVQFFTEELRNAKRASIHREANTQGANTIAKVLQTAEVRRAFPGGIYWNTTPNIARPGRCLLIREDLKLKLGAISIPNPIVTVRVVSATWRSAPGEPGIYIFRLDPEEAERHFLDAGIKADLVSGLAAHHHYRPALVSLVTGILKLGIALPGKSQAKFEEQFENLARALFKGVDANTRTALARYAAFFATPPPSLAPQYDSPGMGAARECGWLLSNATLIPLARAFFRRRQPALVKAEHEAICAYFESKASPSYGITDLFYWQVYLLPHADAAGAAERVEKLLRNPFVLMGYLRDNRAILASQLKGMNGRTPYLDKLASELDDAKWDQAPLDRITSLIAPAFPWPRESGVLDARADRITGHGIRIAVPSTGCNVNHPEFVPSAFSKPVSDLHGYGTQVCSVIAGANIGVAPGAELQADAVLDNQLRLTFLDGLVRYFRQLLNLPSESLPQIVCCTLAYDNPDDDDVLRRMLTELGSRDVLVIASAGNGGPNQLYSPGSYEEVLSVGACGFDGAIAEFSSRGTLHDGERRREIPEIYGYGVTVPAADGEYGYATRDGTTFACAYVCGIAALYAQATGLRGAELRDLLVRTADPSTKLARYSLTTDTRSFGSAE